MGFEPTDACASPVFKTGSFNRSDISPNRHAYPPPEHLKYDTIRTGNLSTGFPKNPEGKNFKKSKIRACILKKAVLICIS